MPGSFIKSASALSECPEHGDHEIALVGRSNAGKSALINALARMKSLARVSQVPGKTELLNFYRLDGRHVFVDTPGYGYAARGKQVRKSWNPLMEEYLENREQLRGVILVMDAQRPWTVDEENLLNWLNSRGLPTLLVLTKVDKLNQKERVKMDRKFSRIQGVLEVVPISNTKFVGIDGLLTTVFEKILSS